MPTVLLLAGSLPCAASRRAAWLACTPESAAFTPCRACNRLLPADLASWVACTTLLRALPAVPERARVRPEVFCSTSWVCRLWFSAAVMATFLPLRAMSRPAIRSEPVTVRLSPARTVRSPLTLPTVLPA
ncbi:Uncharacterised protein [Raoultella planticola]|uniref:Uncharacterized protein n=1 Tax=Raoultella planticola TaxID=575 RepID=A0A8G2A3W8_RAOPL|nr:Uncharacterised protein [Raoultella planticola]